MDRRSFLKSTMAIGAGLLVPTWLGQPKAATLNLQAFCVQYKQGDGVRYKMDSPFTQEAGDGFLPYGTDGKIVIRTRSLIVAPEGDSVKRPPANNLDWRHDSERGWKPWPKQDWITGSDGDWHPICFLCRGTGCEGIAHKCAVCDGSGHDYEGENFHYNQIKCKTCHGTGHAPPHCKRCHGNGLIPNGPDKQPVGHLFIGTEYDNLIRRECGEAEFVIIQGRIAKPRHDGPKTQDLVLFRCAAGDGILVPRNAT
jgi:hypothetical protein